VTDTPITWFLIGVNIVISLLGFQARGAARDRFVLVPYRVKRGQNLMGLALSHFSHADGGHLFLNMIGLYFFGPVIEKGLGEERFLPK
jgi:membrane associated rhomboid family serine protease